ncbi:MAG: IS4 family transposase [Bacteroidota bacterium]|nr:IS4 family transposase [Bacteroidota bacterium]MDE2958329.1 IS4 family transposase [Bacteroidota bacterium]
MVTQNQVLRTLSAPESRDRIEAVVADPRFATRGAIAREMCKVFNFTDARGRWQIATCVKALTKLADRGRIDLPAPTNNYAAGAGPRLLPDAVPMPDNLPDAVRDVQDLAIVRVTDDTQRAVWSTLLHHEHPRGVTKFCGAQMRYLIESAHGYLGAVCFSAAGLRMAAREYWMAWSDAQRKDYQHYVVCLSRFLVRGRCKNLASHVLGRLLNLLPDDFDDQYGYKPWIVETYVDPDWNGTCIKAANFQCIGQTAGGRRQPGDPVESAKALYVYELNRDWRQLLGVPTVELRPVRQPDQDIDNDQWAKAEFGNAPLGNRLRSLRLVKSAAMLADSVGRAITSNTAFDRAAIKGHYRLMSIKPETDVTPENILAPHRMRTVERIRSQSVVLCLQDGSNLNYGSRPVCKDLDVIGRNQTTTQTRGMHLHATLATTADGLPLGVLRCSYTDPTHGPLKPKAQRWLDAYEDTCAMAQEISRKIRVISVMDREGDSLALFDAQQRLGRVHLLVRARTDQRLSKNRQLFEMISGGKDAGRIRIEIKRRSAHSCARDHRIATAELRYRQMTLLATPLAADPVTLSAVHIKEIDPPPGKQAIEWYLLTSLKVQSVSDAKQVIEYYLKRWRIEEFFRVLTSGCKVEDRAYRTALRLQRSLAIHLVIAWHLMLLKLLGRSVPELDASVFFTETELQSLTD